MKQELELELFIPWSALLRIRNRYAYLTDEVKKPHNETPEEHKRWEELLDEWHDWEVVIDAIQDNIIPEIGATGIIFYRERERHSIKGAVTKVISPTKIEVTTFEPNPYTEIFTFRSGKHWVKKGETTRNWSTAFVFG